VGGRVGGEGGRKRGGRTRGEGGQEERLERALTRRQGQVLAASLALCRRPAMLLALIKPQFEAERHEIEAGTGGEYAREVLRRQGLGSRV